MIDLHLHTRRCRHASGSLWEYVSSALDAGLAEVAFSDHLPLLHSDDHDYAMPMEELPQYVADVQEAAESAAQSGRVTVLLGIEADHARGREDETRRLLASYDFDVVLGSVHFIESWAFDDPRLKDGYDTWGVRDLYETYFSHVVDAARSGLFDVMAHLDLVKKFDVRLPEEPVGLYEGVAAELAGAGVAVEVNTAGWRKPCAEAYPSEALLRACRRAHVPATLGSDAHEPGHVGYRFEDARALLARCGYQEIVTFRRREPRRMEL
ncbi:MAG: histidinol-phosphatase [Coriobacteriia bacterium]